MKEQRMLNWQEQIKNNPYFCILPFNHLHVSTIGSTNLCCVANHEEPIDKNISNKTFEEIWHNDTYKSIRAEMISGKPVDRCKGCYKLDNEGGGSDRQTHNRHFVPPNDKWDIDVNKGNTTGNPTWADLRPGRFCNLGCRMCFVAVSSTIADEHKIHPDLLSVTGESWFDVNEWIDDPVLFKMVQQIIPHINTLKLAGGESLFMPGVIKLLKWCITSNNTHLYLDITTNGTRTQGKIMSWLDKFRGVSIQFSIDGVGYTNDYIRYKSKWDEIDAAYRTYLSIPSIQVNILATVQAYNVFDLPNVIQYWYDNGAANNLIFNFVTWPVDMSVDIIPLKERQDVADKIESMISTLTHAQRQQCRLDALLVKLRNTIDPDNIDELRTKWAKRTMKYDTIRNQSIKNVNQKLADYVSQWTK